LDGVRYCKTRRSLKHKKYITIFTKFQGKGIALETIGREKIIAKLTVRLKFIPFKIEIKRLL